MRAERIVLDNYDANELKSRKRVLIAFKHPRPFFERTRAAFRGGGEQRTTPHYVALRGSGRGLAHPSRARSLVHRLPGAGHRIWSRDEAVFSGFGVLAHMRTRPNPEPD